MHLTYQKDGVGVIVAYDLGSTRLESILTTEELLKEAMRDVEASKILAKYASELSTTDDKTKTEVAPKDYPTKETEFAQVFCSRCNANLLLSKKDLSTKRDGSVFYKCPQCGYAHFVGANAFKMMQEGSGLKNAFRVEIKPAT